MITDSETEFLNDFVKNIENSGISNSQLLVLMRYINSSAPHIRVRCLKIIGEHTTPITHIPGSNTKMHELIKWFTEDNDGRVRENAYNTFNQWIDRNEYYKWQDMINYLFDMILYGVYDTEDEVVISCLNLATRIAKLFPNIKVRLESKKTRRLEDAVFCTIASSFSHASFRIRNESARLLSHLETVSENLLMETLEKVVMIDRVVKPSVLQRRSGVSCIRPEDALSRGAGTIGAIVAGLEDEYYEIRTATVSTISKISSRNVEFAMASQDLLVDLLTDDIETVRSAAIAALRHSALSSKAVLRTDQLDIVLGVLSEKSAPVRRSVLQLLSSCRLASPSALMRLLEAGLLHNLRLHPSDRTHVWQCAAKVGLQHPRLVQARLSALLQLHPYLAAQRPPLHDPAYTAVLLLIINAASSLESIAADLPDHIKQSVIYVRELVPDLVTINPITNYDEFILQNRDDNTVNPKVPRKLSNKKQLNTHITSCITDLKHLIANDLQCIKIYKTGYSCNICSNSSSTMDVDNCEDDNNNDNNSNNKSNQRFTGTLLNSLLQNLNQMATLCDTEKGLCLILNDFCKLMIRVLMASKKRISHDDNSRLRLMEAHSIVCKMMFAYSKVPLEDVAKLEAFATNILHKIEALKKQDENNEIDTKSHNICVADLANLFILKMVPEVWPSLVTAKQLYPSSQDTEKSAIKFCSGLSVSLSVRAEFYGLEVMDNNCLDQIIVKTPIVICLECPDGRSVLWHPPIHCWSRVDDTVSSQSSDQPLYLDAAVQFCSTEWSEAGVVKVSLAIDLSSYKRLQRLTEPVGVKIYPIPTYSSI